MAEDWFADVRKYAPDADEGIVGGIVRYCGIALRNRDSALVSFSGDSELERVRTNFLRKKLGLTDADEVLNRGLDAVKDRMKADRTKNRVTVYYLLAEHFGKLGLFAGKATPAKAAAAPVAGSGSAATAKPKAKAAPKSPAAKATTAKSTVTPKADPIPRKTPRAAPVAAPAATTSEPAEPVLTTRKAPASKKAVGRAPTVSDADTSASAPPPAKPAAEPAATPAASAPSLPERMISDDPGKTNAGWPSWLTWVLIAAAVVAVLFLLRGCPREASAETRSAAAITN